MLALTTERTDLHGRMRRKEGSGSERIELAWVASDPGTEAVRDQYCRKPSAL